jgi:hypothetical protein
MSDTDTDITETDETDAQTTQDEPEDAAAVDDSGDADNDPQDETETADDDTPDRRRGVRQRLADAEAERDGLRDTLTRQRQAVWDAATTAAGVDPRLLATAGHTPDSLADEDGVLHAETVTAIANGVADDFGIQRSRRPAPDPLVGHGGGNAPAPKGFGDVLKSVVQGTG